jgi:rubrerythrin
MKEANEKQVAKAMLEKIADYSMNIVQLWTISNCPLEDARKLALKIEEAAEQFYDSTTKLINDNPHEQLTIQHLYQS